MLTLIQGCLLFLLFIAASVIDIKKREIPDSINILIALTGFLTFSPGKLAGILIALPFLITAMIYKGRLGGGDIKFMAAAGFALGFEAAAAAAIIGLSASLLYCAARNLFRLLYLDNDKSFPLAPFLSIGCAAAFLLLS